MMRGSALLIRCANSSSELAEFEPQTGKITVCSGEQLASPAPRPVRGSFARLDDHMVVLYRYEGQLHLRIDASDIELTQDTRAEFTKGSRNRLRVVRAGLVLFALSYKPRRLQPPLDADMTPFVEEEDFDFGLFVYNVLNEQKRRERVYC